MYQVTYSERAVKELSKLDAYTRRMIFAWIEKHLVGCKDPRAHGKALMADLSGKWRYRIGDYRLICQINDGELLIIALNVGHRREVYN